MIYAIPSDNGKVASHFMKAPCFTVFDSDELLSEVNNPAVENSDSCSSKRESLELLAQLKTDAVIVRNIGERALNKLFAMGIRVFKLNGKVDLHTATQSSMVELTSSIQARPSLQYIKKHNGQKSEGSCCGSSHASKGIKQCHSMREKRHGNRSCCSREA